MERHSLRAQKGPDRWAGQAKRGAASRSTPKRQVRGAFSPHGHTEVQAMFGKSMCIAIPPSRGGC